MERVALAVTPPEVPEITTDLFMETGIVEMGNVADVFPMVTTTFAGTVTEGSPLERITISPPAGAAAESVTVPVAGAPPTTVVGKIVTFTMASHGRTVIGCLTVVAPIDAPMLAVTVLDTGPVPTGKLIVECPWGTVTLD
jgi:hypothetical protein